MLAVQWGRYPVSRSWVTIRQDWFHQRSYDFVWFRKSNTVQCRTHRATRFCWLLWSAVDWNGILCVSALYCPDDEISSGFSKVLAISFQM
jgi:hypothetical protein